MSHKPETIDEYLSTVDDEKREALEELRRAIKSAAPRAEECISYEIPAFRLDGRVLVFFAAATNHCSFFPGPWPIEALKAELERTASARARSGSIHRNRFRLRSCGSS